MLDSLGYDDFLINTARQKVLLCVSRFVTAKHRHIAFRILQRFLHQKIQGIALGNGIRVINANIFTMRDL